MEKFRNLTKNIFFKIFLGFLGLTFVMFGVGDFILGSSSSYVAKIDGKKIAYNDFSRKLQNDRERIYRSNPTEKALAYLNSNQFRDATVKNIIVQRLIGEVQEYFGIYPDEDLILNDIAAHPKFQNESGQFNRIAFINHLKINNFSEQSFINNVARDIANSIVVSSLTYDSEMNNDQLVRDIFSYKEEKRRADVITISVNNVASVKGIKKEELTAFFEQNKNKYILPELREVSYIEFDEKQIMPKVKVTEEEIVAYYENSSFYSLPATKDFYHLVFDDEIAAYKFLNDLDKEAQDKDNVEKVFLDLALKYQDRKETDILLNNITNKDLLPEISQIAFDLSVGSYSDILPSTLGFHIFYLVRQTEKYQKALTLEIKNEVRENLLLEKEEESLVAKIEEIDDKILTSNSLKEVAKEFGFKVRKITKFDRNGFDKRKKDIMALVNLDQFIKNSFLLPVGEASELYTSRSNGKYYAVFVNKIEDSRQQNLDEVLKWVKKSFTSQQRKTRLIQLANKVYKQIQDEEITIRQAIARNGLKVERNKEFQRSYKVSFGGRDINYANEFVKDLFDVDVGEITRPHLISDREIHIGVVRKVVRPKASSKKVVDLKEELSDQFKNNILSSYDDYLQVKFPIEINYDAFRGNQDEGL